MKEHALRPLKIGLWALKRREEALLCIQIHRDDSYVAFSCILVFFGQKISKIWQWFKRLSVCVWQRVCVWVCVCVCVYVCLCVISWSPPCMAESWRRGSQGHGSFNRFLTKGQWSFAPHVGENTHTLSNTHTHTHTHTHRYTNIHTHTECWKTERLFLCK